jgi:Na+/melibiose symporter-like transporter
MVQEQKRMSKEKKQNPDKIGTGKFWAWQTRGVSAAINFIILSYITIYCTDALKMPAALVGTLLMITKICDGITDLFAGYIVDKTKSKFGKGRPYEFAILGAWLCTWFMYSVPGEASLVVKSAWIILMYTCVQSICITLLSACQNPYMIRAFKTNGQRVKLASFGGLVIMAGSMAISVMFPVLMNRIAVSPAGWSKLIAMVAVPLGLIGILRFVFVKETVHVEEAEGSGEKVTLKDVGELLRHNPYLYMVAFMWAIYSLVTGMGIAQYFYTYIVGNI